MKSMGSCLICALACVVSLPAWAVYKCRDPGGNTVFQDTPCADGGGSLKIGAPPSFGTADDSGLQPGPRFEAQNARHREAINAGIVAGEPVIGMTRAQLDLAMGPPTTVNGGNYSGERRDQIIYRRSGGTVYVYTENGFVTAIQDRPETMPTRRVTRQCPSSLEIRNVETSLSSISLRTGERDRLSRQLEVMKACRP